MAVFNVKKHTDGGPLADYMHLTDVQQAKARQYSSPSSEGIMPAGVLRNMLWSSVPPVSVWPGKKGQKATDANYFYVCVKDNLWKRTGKENVF